MGTEQLLEGRACKEAAGVSQVGWEGRGASSYQPPNKAGAGCRAQGEGPSIFMLATPGPWPVAKYHRQPLARDLAEATALKVRGYKREAEGCGSRSDA